MKKTRTPDVVARLAKFDALKNIPFAVSYHMMFGKWPKGYYHGPDIVKKDLTK